jgi:hypothetical protein
MEARLFALKYLTIFYFRIESSKSGKGTTVNKPKREQKIIVILNVAKRRHDTRNDDSLHSDIWRNNENGDTQHNGTRYIVLFCRVLGKSYSFSVVLLSVVARLELHPGLCFIWQLDSAFLSSSCLHPSLMYVGKARCWSWVPEGAPLQNSQVQ